LAKGLHSGSFRERFEDRLERYKRRWDEEMREHLADVPSFDDVVRAVRRQLRSGGLLDCLTADITSPSSTYTEIGTPPIGAGTFSEDTGSDGAVTFIPESLSRKAPTQAST
jgi:hypothetical protein